MNSNLKQIMQAGISVRDKLLDRRLCMPLPDHAILDKKEGQLSLTFLPSHAVFSKAVLPESTQFAIMVCAAGLLCKEISRNFTGEVTLLDTDPPQLIGEINASRGFKVEASHKHIKQLEDSSLLVINTSIILEEDDVVAKIDNVELTFLAN